MGWIIAIVVIVIVIVVIAKMFTGESEVDRERKLREQEEYIRNVRSHKYK